MYNIIQFFIAAFATYINTALGVDMPDNNFWYCSVGVLVVLTSIMCSNLFIVSMTFQRFYGIVQLHKVALFNTVKRAKITIVCIVIFSFIFRFPHLFTTKIQGQHCIIYGKILGEAYSQFYYWLTFVLNFATPFVSLLIMNIVIIITLQKRTNSNLLKSMRN